MAQIVVDCPHCGAQSMAMRVFGTHTPGSKTITAFGGKCFFDVAATCDKCSKPVVARIRSQEDIRSWNDFSGIANKYSDDPTASPEKFNLFAIVIKTPPIRISVPEHLSPAITKSFLMAEQNFLLPNCEEASAAMYRRAIDLAVKSIDPDGKGELIARINRLADLNILPGTMKDWAHQVRIIGNDGAHDEDGVTRNDLMAAQGFADALLRYLFTLPKEVALRRAATEVPAAPLVEGAGG